MFSLNYLVVLFAMWSMLKRVTFDKLNHCTEPTQRFFIRPSCTFETRGGVSPYNKAITCRRQHQSYKGDILDKNKINCPPWTTRIVFQILYFPHFLQYWYCSQICWYGKRENIKASMQFFLEYDEKRPSATETRKTSPWEELILSKRK